MMLILALFPCLGFAKISENDWVRRVHSHLMIDDTSSALEEAKKLVGQYPDSKAARSAFILALSANGMEQRALEEWDSLSKQEPELAFDRNLLEELSWGVLRKGVESTQYGVRLASLIGAFLTNDVRALPIFLKMLKDSNAVIRSVAVQMVGQYRDAPLKDEIARMIREEKVWMVRLEVIKTAGVLKMKEMVPYLKQLIQSENTTYEERLRAIEALSLIYDDISLSEWLYFAKSNRAGMRHLACSLAAHFQLKEGKNEILRLMHDTHPDVRIAAINAFGLFYRQIATPEETENHLKLVLEDPSPEVAITAAWASLLSGLKTEEIFQKWLFCPLSEVRRFAAAALAMGGEKGVEMASTFLQSSDDMYVKANLALGLIGQRKEVSICCDILYQFLEKEKRMWMWDQQPNPLFSILAPSQVRHVDHIPNYPEAIDQMTRLNLVSLLALVEDPRALDAVKSFLKKKNWGITGVAAATLLHEGDESGLEMVRQLLHDSDPDVRLQACFVLAMIGRDETVLHDLQKAYAGADHQRKLHILEAMGKVGHVESFHFLLSAFREPFPILRVAAAAALIQSIHR